LNFNPLRKKEKPTRKSPDWQMGATNTDQRFHDPLPHKQLSEKCVSKKPMKRD